MKHEESETCWRRHVVYLNESDEVAFSRVLREFNPQTVIVEYDSRAPKYREFDAIVPTIAHSRSDHVNIYIPWRSDVYPRPSQKNPCWFSYRRSSWIWYEPDHAERTDPPHLREGEWVAYFPCDDLEIKKFALKALRLVRRVTWNFKAYPLPFDAREGGFRSGRFGLSACRWSQMGGPVRRAVGGGHPIPAEAKIELNKYYDDSFWDDRLPDAPTMSGHECLEWHWLPVRRRALDPRER